MLDSNAAKIFKTVAEAQATAEKKQAMAHPDKIIKIARQRGYKFSKNQIKKEIPQLSEEELASLLNPGVSPRHHLLPR
ncbi:MAG TPA: Nif11-like leader peptide family natural product precursor [Oscillatoriaceae cyanobacterium M33_DOE_052]|uniref:Nif11-like leader peptide family natural product n=1 Tax=Planktothricoides sp. SpSt-374 TaxID=2282167 RepID=A0A7C3ZH23_9CYAN|nr:Nif11-like leader peptide family natural product precursor [Oscillatoriaceae cyanobacterium M33_DOE_052]